MAIPHIAVTTSASTATPAVPTHNMENGLRYWFFLNDDTKSDTDYPKLYEHLIASAQSKIVIWDPHIHCDDMKLLANVTLATKLVILTSSSKKKWEEKRDNMYDKLKTYVPNPKKSSLSVELGYINTDIYGTKKWNCHDRFLIIDDAEYFLIGSSMAHHWSNQSSTGILHIEHQADESVIQKAFDKVYNEATKKEWITLYTNLL